MKKIILLLLFLIGTMCYADEIIVPKTVELGEVFKCRIEGIEQYKKTNSNFRIEWIIGDDALLSAGDNTKRLTILSQNDNIGEIELKANYTAGSAVIEAIISVGSERIKIGGKTENLISIGGAPYIEVQGDEEYSIALLKNVDVSKGCDVIWYVESDDFLEHEDDNGYNPYIHDISDEFYFVYDQIYSHHHIDYDDYSYNYYSSDFGKYGWLGIRSPAGYLDFVLFGVDGFIPNLQLIAFIGYMDGTFKKVASPKRHYFSSEFKEQRVWSDDELYDKYGWNSKEEILDLKGAVNFAYDASGNRISRTLRVASRTLMTYEQPQEILAERIAKRDVKIYSSIEGQITVEFSSLEGMKNGTMQIYSFPNGAFVLNQKVVSLRENLDISTKASGIYILVIDIDGERTSYKLMK